MSLQHGLKVGVWLDGASSSWTMNPNNPDNQIDEYIEKWINKVIPLTKGKVLYYVLGDELVWKSNPPYYVTVTITCRPISTTIEGNTLYSLQNSAVRGVWGNRQKAGANYYTVRSVRLVRMHNAVYGVVDRTPVVQCRGMYAVLDGDPVDVLFDTATGECIDRPRLMERCHMSLDAPKLGMTLPRFTHAPSRVYEGDVSLVANHMLTVDARLQKHIREHRGAAFIPRRVRYGSEAPFDESTIDNPGYSANLDINSDGVINEENEALVAQHIGRTVRANLYLHAYFGGDWLSTNVCLEPEHRSGIPVLADYDYGGGYDANAGVIRLLETPGPNQCVWVEYFHCEPAQAGHEILSCVGNEPDWLRG